MPRVDTRNLVLEDLWLKNIAAMGDYERDLLRERLKIDVILTKVNQAVIGAMRLYDIQLALAARMRSRS